MSGAQRQEVLRQAPDAHEGREGGAGLAVLGHRCPWGSVRASIVTSEAAGLGGVGGGNGRGGGGRGGVGGGRKDVGEGGGDGGGEDEGGKGAARAGMEAGVAGGAGRER